MTERTVAVTGASGFIGSHLVRSLTARGFAVRALVRSAGAGPLPAGTHVVGDLRAPRGLAAALEGVDVVVHAAGLAHAGADHADSEVDAINRAATVELARTAAAAGVRRFLFLSSVRAQSGPSADRVLDETTPPAPADAYGRSKLAAERELAGVGIDWAALRPVLVYGQGVGGNMAALVRLARLPLPLPFGAVRAKRSLLAVENLVDAVALLALAPGRLERPFLVADAEPLDLGEMLRALRRGLGRPPRLVPVPPFLLGLALRTIGRSEALDRLVRPLIVDTAALRGLGWRPRIASDAGLTALAAAPHVTPDRASKEGPA